MEDSYELFGHDVCLECAKSKKYKELSKLKIQQTNLKRYGVKWTQQNKLIKEKSKETCLQKYGVENVALNSDILAKIESTNLQRYGETTPLKNKEVQKKIEESALNSLGVSNPFYSQEIQDSIKRKNLEKYGVEYPFQSSEIQKKARTSLALNGGIPTSKPQKQLKKMIANMYPKYKVELNKPVEQFFLDIALIYDNVKIDIEYDGIYWHQDEEKDKARDSIVKKNGYKILRIRSSRKLPEREELKHIIDKMFFSDLDFYSITI